MLTPEQAWKAIEAELRPRSSRRVRRQEAVGLTLATDLTATVDMPPADVSAMDGYACAGEMPLDRELKVMGTVAAGRVPDFELTPGTVAKIMTGAVVPRGADRVIPVEKSTSSLAQSSATGHVVFTEGEASGAHIRRGGEVVRRGEPLLSAGTLLTPGGISLAASHGLTELDVLPAPEVSVIVTGDEVVPPDQEPEPGQLRDSNSGFLLAAGRSHGLEFRHLGIASDHLEDLKEMIARGLDSEVLLLSGGVSMGEFDLVEDVLAELGCRQLFDKVAIQPGKPLVAARHDRGWVFGLPGNPASVMVTYWLFVRPLIRRLMGLPGFFWHGALAAELAAAAPGSKGRDRFLSARVRFDNGRILATPRPPRGSHDVAAYAWGNALLRIPPRSRPGQAGDRCEILPLGDWVDQDS